MQIFWKQLFIGIITTILPIAGFIYIKNRTCTDDPGICAMNDSLYNYPLTLFICIGVYLILKSFKKKINYNKYKSYPGKKRP